MKRTEPKCDVLSEMHAAKWHGRCPEALKSFREVTPFILNRREVSAVWTLEALDSSKSKMRLMPSFQQEMGRGGVSPKYPKHGSVGMTTAATGCLSI